MRLWMIAASALAVSGCTFLGSEYGQNESLTLQAGQANGCYNYSGVTHPVSYGSCEAVNKPVLPPANCANHINIQAPCEPVAVNTSAIGTFPTHSYSHGVPAYSSHINHGAAQSHFIHHVDNQQVQYKDVPKLRKKRVLFSDTPYFYSNLGVTSYDLSDDVYGAQARLGYQSGKLIGAELEGSLGFTNSNDVFTDTSTVPSTDFDVETHINYSAAAFGTVRLPITEEFSVFGRGGYHATQVDAEVQTSAGGATPPATLGGRETVDGLAYGAGAEFAFNRHNALRIDYTRYEYDNLGTADSGSIAYVRRF